MSLSLVVEETRRRKTIFHAEGLPKVGPEPERGYPYRHACLVKLPFVLLKKRKEKEAVCFGTVSHTGGEANTQLKQIAACSKQSRVHDVLPLRCIEETERRVERKRSRADKRATQMPVDGNIIDADVVARMVAFFFTAGSLLAINCHRARLTLDTAHHAADLSVL